MHNWWYNLYFADPQLWFFVTLLFILLLFVGMGLLEKVWIWAERKGLGKK